jgi:hypothetical protein
MLSYIYVIVAPHEDAALPVSVASGCRKQAAAADSRRIDWQCQSAITSSNTSSNTSSKGW